MLDLFSYVISVIYNHAINASYMFQYSTFTYLNTLVYIMIIKNLKNGMKTERTPVTYVVNKLLKFESHKSQ